MRPFAFPVPTVNMFALWNQTNLSRVQQAIAMPTTPFLMPNLAKIDSSGKKLKELADDYPEAVFNTVYAANRFIGFTKAVLDDNTEESHRRMVETAESAYRAAGQPTLVQRMPVKYTARCVGVIADVGVLKIAPDAPPLHVRRVRDTLPALLSQGLTWPKQRNEFVELAIKLIQSQPPPRLKAAWKLDTPAEREAYRLRNRQLFVIARDLLETWADEVSMNPGKDAHPTAAKVNELRQSLHKWAEAERASDAANEQSRMPGK
jgi:hypothetical protein